MIGLGERWRLLAEERLELAVVGDRAEQHPKRAEQLVAPAVGRGRRHEQAHHAEVVEEPVEQHIDGELIGDSTAVAPIAR